MNAVINLKLIGELAMETYSNKHLMDSLCYNSDRRKTPIDPLVFVETMNAYRQAQNLHGKLTKLKTICLDFAAGRFDAYIDDYNEYAEETDDPYDPFEDLCRCFDTQSVDDLPTKIEQYAELVHLASLFAEMRRVKWEGLTKFFGSLTTYYRAIGEDGEPIMIPADALPESERTKLEAEKSIKEVEVEYALDSYNGFYEVASAMLNNHCCGDIKACAEDILSLYRD